MKRVIVVVIIVHEEINRADKTSSLVHSPSYRAFVEFWYENYCRWFVSRLSIGRRGVNPRTCVGAQVTNSQIDRTCKNMKKMENIMKSREP
jgi:hypothetical protein